VSNPLTPKEGILLDRDGRPIAGPDAPDPMGSIGSGESGSGRQERARAYSAVWHMPRGLGMALFLVAIPVLLIATVLIAAAILLGIGARLVLRLVTALLRGAIGVFRVMVM
jgi:hypothetical protein